MDQTANWVIAGSWIFFLVYWLVSAARTKKILEQQSYGSTLAHRIPVGLGWWLLIFRRFPSPLNMQVVPHTNLSLAIGTVVCLGGLFITIWARRTLAGNWSSNVTFKQEHELVRTGPYRFVRHPIYTGLLVMCIGTSIAAGPLHCWLGTLVMAIGFWIKLSQEERLLARHFPEEYPLYRKQVKALVPWVI